MFTFLRAEEVKDPRVTKLTKITVGTMDLDKDNGQELRAIELHHHPDRIKLETKHRSCQSRSTLFDFLLDPTLL